MENKKETKFKFPIIMLILAYLILFSTICNAQEYYVDKVGRIAKRGARKETMYPADLKLLIRNDSMYVCYSSEWADYYTLQDKIEFTNTTAYWATDSDGKKSTLLIKKIDSTNISLHYRDVVFIFYVHKK